MDFQIGDYVEVISQDGEWNAALELGMVGRVVNIGGWKCARGKLCIGVDFADAVIGEKDADLYFHSVGGVLDTDTGYYLEPDQLRLFEEQEIVLDVDLMDLLEV